MTGMSISHDQSLKATSFTIDNLGDKDFPGYSKGDDWNGFACPYFTFDQAQALAEEWRKTGYRARYDADSDSFIFGLDAGGGVEQEDTDEFSPVEIDGTKYYPIGAGCWIWSEAES